MLKKLFLTLFFYFLFTPIGLTKPITILTTNDLHGRLNSFNYGELKDVGGAARRTTLFKNYPNALIIDAGDFAQGTIYFKVVPENLNLKIMDTQNYDAIALGNHEFDKGENYIKNSAKLTKIPLLSCNIKFEDKELNSLIKDYVIKNIDGINVGIIGVLDTTVNATSTRNENRYTAHNEIKSIKRVVKKIDKKTDLIILLSHAGLKKDEIIAQKVKGLDLIIGGHTHTYLKEPIKVLQKNKKLVLISQNGEFGYSVGKWEIDVKNDEIKNYNFEQIQINSGIPKDKKTQEIIDKYDKSINEKFNIVIGTTDIPIDARRQIVGKELTTAGALLHQSIKNKYPEVEISANTSGGYRYGKFLPKDIKIKDIEELFPFNSYVVILDIKGSDIKSILETSARFFPQPAGSFLQSYGISYTIDTNKQPQILNDKLDKILKKGERVSNILINGVPLKENRYYKFAIDNFMYYGGDGYIQLQKYKNAIHTYDQLDKVLIEYLQQNSPVEVKLKDKVILK